MALPAILWGLATGRGVWYPVNLLAAMVRPGLGDLPAEELGRYRADWFFTASAIHVALSLGFGVVYGLLLPKVKPIPGPVAWGGLLLPLVWTGLSYGLMGVVDPALQQRVDWPWFIASQFVFGLVASVVVLRSEMVYIPPAGAGPDRAADFLAGPSS
jgi:hypothetical protein